MQMNYGEGTPPKVTFDDVYKNTDSEAEVTTELRGVEIRDTESLLPYLAFGALLGALIKYHS